MLSFFNHNVWELLATTNHHKLRRGNYQRQSLPKSISDDVWLLCDDFLLLPKVLFHVVTCMFPIKLFVMRICFNTPKTTLFGLRQCNKHLKSQDSLLCCKELKNKIKKKQNKINKATHSPRKGKRHIDKERTTSHLYVRLK